MRDDVVKQLIDHFFSVWRYLRLVADNVPKCNKYGGIDIEAII